MSKKYLKLHKSQLQQIVGRIEEQCGSIPFHTLCVMVAETVVGQQYKFTPGKVRLRLLGEGLTFKCPPPQKITLNNIGSRLNYGEYRPFCVSYGMGVDSTAMLIYLGKMYVSTGKREYRPDVITFADTGNEKLETYKYLSVINVYLRSVGFPEVQVVVYKPDWTLNGEYHTLEQNCLVNSTLPSLAFGFKKCSNKWKIGPQDEYRESLPIVQKCLATGLSVIVAIGYDAGPKDSCRAWDITDDENYHYIYPLMELGWDRERCIAEIRKEGLAGYPTDKGGEWVKKGGVPVKSACWFCPSTQPEELEAFSKTPHGREYLSAIVRMEENAKPFLTDIEGLWRNGVKGTRGGKKKPGSMTQYIKENRLLDGRRKSLPIVEQFTFTKPEQVAGVM